MSYIRPFSRGTGRTIVGEEHLSPEFLHEIGDNARVILEPGYNQDELFDDQFERRAREKIQTPGASSGIAIIPAKQGPWTANNSLGIERAFSPDDNNRQTILKLDEWDFPEVWSVMLGMSYSDGAWGSSLGAAFAVTANVVAGVGGAVQELEVDWAQGTTFSLNMNALSLIAEYQASLSTPSDLRLVASIAKGKIAGRPPTRSYQLNAVITGGVDSVSDIIRIPPFARSLTVLDRSVNTAFSNYQAGVVLEFLQNPNVPINTSGVATVQGVNLASFAANGVPIPLFSRYVRMFVASTLVAVSTNLVFHLAL